MNEIEEALDRLHGEIQQKLGAHVVVYQQIEAMLNFLAAYGDFDLGDDEERRPEVDGEDFDSLRKRLLAEITRNRQELFHQFLLRCNWISESSLRRALRDLDARMATLQPGLSRLEALVKEQQGAMKAWAGRLDGQSVGDMLKEHTALLKVLDDYARMMPGHERWVPVYEVNHRLNRAMPVEMAMLAEAYGSPSLLSLIRTCGLFEVRAVETGAGPEYWYRLKKMP